MRKCFNCIKNKENDNLCGFTDYCQFCFEHDYCSWEHDETKPLYTFPIAKQLIFDCAMDLHYKTKEIEEISANLLSVLSELDKMKVGGHYC